MENRAQMLFFPRQSPFSQAQARTAAKKMTLKPFFAISNFRNNKAFGRRSQTFPLIDSFSQSRMLNLRSTPICPLKKALQTALFIFATSAPISAEEIIPAISSTIQNAPKDVRSNIASEIKKHLTHGECTCIIQLCVVRGLAPARSCTFRLPALTAQVRHASQLAPLTCGNRGSLIRGLTLHNQNDLYANPRGLLIDTTADA